MRNEIVTHAKNCVGTPYHPQGRLFGKGLDCIGLLIYAAGESGYKVVDFKRYNEEPGQPELFHYLDLNFDEIELDDRQPGDILVFWYNKRDSEQHIGIQSDVGLVHTYQSVGRVVEHSMPEFWEKRLMRAYKFRDAQDFTKVLETSRKVKVKRITPKGSCCGG